MLEVICSVCYIYITLLLPIIMCLTLLALLILLQSFLALRGNTFLRNASIHLHVPEVNPLHWDSWELLSSLFLTLLLLLSLLFLTLLLLLSLLF